MKGATFAANRMLKIVGVFEGLPRILNVDLNTYEVGYTQINVMATTAFSRTKTHKGWFSGTADITNGTRIIDRVDDNKYLVMSIKAEYAGGLVAFKDATLFKVNEICSLTRFSSNLDSFGRVSTATPVTIATDIWTMVNPLTIDVEERADRVIDKDKIKFAIQSSVSVAVNDRFVTSSGENFKVVAYSRAEIEGLLMVYVVPDTR